MTYRDAKTSPYQAVQLAIVVPTYNERSNVDELVRRLEAALTGLAWEVVFVDDDSPDGTSEVLRDIAACKRHVRCVQRIGRRGLSRAVIEGILSTCAPVVAVMDADLQHDETLLPGMLRKLEEELLDVVVASRYSTGGSVGAWSADREQLSRLATRMARAVIGTELADPMSGYFMMRRRVFESAVHNLSGEGYKILLDVLASAPQKPLVGELPYTFRPRIAGESKLDSAVIWEFGMLLLDKRIGRWIPARFVLFSLVGSSGVLVHFSVLWLAFRMLGLGFGPSQTTATIVAMTTNYALNNALTYRDRRHRGLGWARGLLSFYAICGLGVIANVGVASALFHRQADWLVAAAAGAFLGTVWNYFASSVVTWKRL